MTVTILKSFHQLTALFKNGFCLSIYVLDEYSDIEPSLTLAEHEAARSLSRSSCRVSLVAKAWRTCSPPSWKPYYSCSLKTEFDATITLYVDLSNLQPGNPLDEF